MARNRGMSSANGEFLLFLDSDDLIPSDKLEKQIRKMNEDGTDCCISDFATVDEIGQLIAIYRNDRPPKHFIKYLRSPSNSAILMRRRSLHSNLIWNVKLKRMQDFDFMLRYLSGVKTWSYIPEPLYFYRLHNGPRISDSYTDSGGMPYFEMFRSVSSHIIAINGLGAGTLGLISTFGSRLLYSKLRDVGSSVPGPIKLIIKALLFQGR